MARSGELTANRHGEQTAVLVQVGGGIRSYRLGEREGAHPYLRLSSGRSDDAVLHVPAQTWLPTDPAQIPIGREPVAASPCDFREPRVVGPLHVDHTSCRPPADRLARCAAPCLS